MMDHTKAAEQLWELCTGKPYPKTPEERAVVATIRGALDEVAAETLLLTLADARKEAERCARIAERIWHGGPIALAIRERWRRINWLTPVVAATDPVQRARETARKILRCLAEEKDEDGG